MMRIIYLGDIVGSVGRTAVRNFVKVLREEYTADYIFVNCENASGGRGITAENYIELRALGIDAFSTGNHIWAHKSIEKYLKLPEEPIIIPANYPHTEGIKKYYTCISKDSIPVTVVNILGRVFMNPVECPFSTIDAILQDIPKEHCIIVDIHAEATSEKKSLAFYLDGRITALVGTHTHVQTNDATIFPQGMGYITDLGMCGAECSVLGVKHEDAIYRLTHARGRYLTPAEGKGTIQGVCIDIDSTTKKVSAIKTIKL